MNIQAKANANYTCTACGSTEIISAHHQIPKDDSSLRVLCAYCHHDKHPDLPLGLFTNKVHQPFWENKSMSSIAKGLGVHSRTVERRAKILGIQKGILSTDDEELLKKTFGIKVDGKYSTRECKQCGHKWAARLSTDRVRICPNRHCHSMFWDEKKRKK